MTSRMPILRTFSRRGPTGAVVAFCVSLLSFASCRPDRPDASAKEAEARARATTQALSTEKAAGAPEGDQAPKGALTEEQRALVVARIGDRAITLGDVERRLADEPVFVRAKYGAFDKKVEFLESLVQFELLAGEAQRKGLDKDPEVVLAMKRAMVEEFLRSDVQARAPISPVTEAEAKLFFDNNKTLFQKPAAVRVSRLRLADKAEADKAVTELRAAIGDDAGRAKTIFGDFVRRMSKDDFTIGSNGDVGYVVREGYVEGSKDPAPVRLPEAVVTAAFELPGQTQISEPIPVEGGFDVLQVTDRRPAVERSFEEARRQITNALFRDKQEKARADFVAGLRANAKVEIDESALGLIDVNALTKPRNPTGGMPPGPFPGGVGIPPALAPLPPLPASPVAPTGPESGALVPPSGLTAPTRLSMPRADPGGIRARQLLDPTAARLPPGALKGRATPASPLPESTIENVKQKSPHP